MSRRKRELLFQKGLEEKRERGRKGLRAKQTSELKAIGMRREVAQLGLVGIA